MTIEEQIRTIVRQELEALQNKLAQEDNTMLTTDEVMFKYGIKSKATLHNYHRIGLPYIKSRPNRYRLVDLESFFTKNKIIK